MNQLYDPFQDSTPTYTIRIYIAGDYRDAIRAAHGWFWASQREAARALGVRPDTVTHHLDRGTFDRLVLRRLGINSAAAGLPPPVEN